MLISILLLLPTRVNDIISSGQQNQAISSPVFFNAAFRWAYKREIYLEICQSSFGVDDANIYLDIPPILQLSEGIFSSLLRRGRNVSLLRILSGRVRPFRERRRLILEA